MKCPKWREINLQKLRTLSFGLGLLIAFSACSDSSGGGVVPAPPLIGTTGWEREPAPIDPLVSADNVHYNSGGRRIVRINGTTILLVTENASDHLFRSSDGGDSWLQIDDEDGYSGCLVSGRNNYVYHFSRVSSAIRVVKFVYDAVSIPAPEVIYGNVGSSNHGVYSMLNATVDQNGHLYVFFHYDTGTGGDSIFVMKSEDDGVTWSIPSTVRTGNSSHSYGFMHSDVTPGGAVVLVYSEWDSLTSQFARSSDGGTTWVHSQIATWGVTNKDAFNPSVLPVGANDIYVFAQSPTLDGLVYKKSSDSGSTWPIYWTSIQGNHEPGYADPSPALGSDGTIFVAFRGSPVPTALSDDLREYVAMSQDNGATWTFPDNHLNGGRVGTRSVLRYQTWHNYGGPLEWSWLEEAGENTEIYPTLYDQNADVSIANITN